MGSGEGGYQVGNFPPQWTEWNGKYRDTVRDFWRGEPATLDEFAYRLSGSADLYEHTARRPVASINFVIAHDGFTLRDLVSYNEKHNEANGEDNNDGESHNRSWNCGAEGPTDDEQVNELRARQQRNFLTTLLLSQGVPMICHGDELGRTQDGNNNGYCQDNELTWIDWDSADAGLLEFTRTVSALRGEHPVFRRRRFFSGKPMQLVSAAALARGTEVVWSHTDEALLHVRELSDAFIAAYLDAEWPAVAGCVGVFRIEGLGVQLFDRIEGDQFTVLGMPLLAVLAALRAETELTA